LDMHCTCTAKFKNCSKFIQHSSSSSSTCSAYSASQLQCASRHCFC
jgi:hypothetical protein